MASTRYTIPERRTVAMVDDGLVSERGSTKTSTSIVSRSNAGTSRNGSTGAAAGKPRELRSDKPAEMGNATPRQLRDNRR